MRIIGYIDHPVLKITVFKMGHKISIKLESGLLEQTYKFREGEGLESFEDAQKFVNESFASKVLKEFSRMNQIKKNSLSCLLPGRESEEFDEII